MSRGLHSRLKTVVTAEHPQRPPREKPAIIAARATCFQAALHQTGERPNSIREPRKKVLFKPFGRGHVGCSGQGGLKAHAGARTSIVPEAISEEGSAAVGYDGAGTGQVPAQPRSSAPRFARTRDFARASSAVADGSQPQKHILYCSTPRKKAGSMDRNLALDLARVTEAAALNASTHMGRGDKIAADQAGVDGMRKMFDNLDIDGLVVIGEGEMDEAPMLYIGERVGRRGPHSEQVDIAVDPVEGTNSVAKGLPNAIAVVAMAPRGCLLNAPDMYMDKIAVGPRAAGKVHLDAPVHENLRATAEALGKSLSDLTVTMLDRPRHAELIRQCRETGARIKLFQDGDVAAALATCFDYTGVDIMLGIGGAPEGVIAAAGLKCLGGQFEGRLIAYEDAERERCAAMGLNIEQVLRMEDLAKGNEIYFAATGISDGELLKGVTYSGNNIARTHSVVMRSKSGTIRFIEAVHKLSQKPAYAH
jgi:fructose-1,6-bisphosphatase II